MIVGIDLGMTNSAAAILENGETRLIPNALGDLLTPSAVADAKLRVAALKKLRKDPQGCVQFIVQPAQYARGGNAPVILTEAYRNQIYTVLHDDYGTVKWAFAPNEFVLPGELVGELIDRSALSEKRVRAAVSARDSNDPDTCIVTTSLLELLTEIPRKQSEKILPVLL